MTRQEAAKKRAAEKLAQDPDYYRNMAKKTWTKDHSRKVGFATMPREEVRRISRVAGIKSGEAKRKNKHKSDII